MAVLHGSTIAAGPVSGVVWPRETTTKVGDAESDPRWGWLGLATYETITIYIDLLSLSLSPDMQLSDCKWHCNCI